MPNSDELNTLAAIDDRICQIVKERAEGIHVLALTNATMREVVFYIKEGAGIAAIHQSIIDSVELFEIKCVAVHDPKMRMIGIAWDRQHKVLGSKESLSSR